MTDNLTPASETDYLALSDEFMQLQQEVQRVNEYERKQKTGEPLSPMELEAIAALPEKLRRAVDITRILRRTNTGPAKVKTKSTRANKKALAQEEISKLLDM